MRRQRVLELWTQYREAVVGPNFTEDQRKQLRMAFYGGASSLMFLILRELTAGPDSTAEDQDMLMDIQNELAKFADDAKTGKV